MEGWDVASEDFVVEIGVGVTEQEGPCLAQGEWPTGRG